MNTNPENSDIAPGETVATADLPGEARLPLTPAAERALAEAAARRQAQQGQTATTPAEIGGPKGPDPVRYGDWEKGGIASDF